LIQDLRGAGFCVDYSLTPVKPDKQFKRAQETGARKTIKLERDSNSQLLARARDLKTREEKTAPLSAAAALLRQAGS